MTKTEELLTAALRKVEGYDNELAQAHSDIFIAGLNWLFEFEISQAEGDWRYSDGSKMSPDRMYRITQEGRATIRLAEAILGVS
jgi:hypothetical protein